MNIREALQLEHSRDNAMRIAHFAVTSPEHFKELMECFATNEYRLSQRAAWSVSWAARHKPEMVKPYIELLVSRLQLTQVHPAVIRNTVRILELIDIPERYHGIVMDSCFKFIASPQTPVAIKAFSLTTLYNLSRVYPEIQSELHLIIEERWATETAAFRSRGKKILTAIHKNQGLKSSGN